MSKVGPKAPCFIGAGKDCTELLNSAGEPALPDFSTIACQRDEGNTPKLMFSEFQTYGAWLIQRTTPGAW